MDIPRPMARDPHAALLPVTPVKMFPYQIPSGALHPKGDFVVRFDSISIMRSTGILIMRTRMIRRTFTPSRAWVPEHPCGRIPTTPTALWCQGP